MDEAQAVLKATDDEAKRICQEIRRIGGTDRALELFLRDGPGWLNDEYIVIGRYTVRRHLTRGFCSLNSRNYFFGGGIGPEDSASIAFLEH